MIDLLGYEEYELTHVYAEELHNLGLVAENLNVERFKMDSINQVVIEGFVGSDPFSYDFEDGNNVCHLSLGLVKYRKNDEGALERKISFVPVDIFNPEMAFRKGDELRVTGSLKLDRWMKDDVWQSKLKVIANTVSFR